MPFVVMRPTPGGAMMHIERQSRSHISMLLVVWLLLLALVELLGIWKDLTIAVN